MPSSILVVGAGASGLLAARRLAAEGLIVTLLEASAIPGGRMYSLSIPGFAGSVEAGAEFVHGDLPISLQLAREAGVSLIPTRHAQLSPDTEGVHQSDHWDELMEKMNRLQEDQPFASFLTDYFPGPTYAGLRRSARRFAEGFDLADLSTVSTKALYTEWASEEDSGEYRVEGGYVRLVDFLVRDCKRLGVVFHFATPVTEICWQKGIVEMATAGGERFTGERAIVTVSLGMLPRIGFTPSIPEYLDAARGIGYGSVIKILLEFRTAFWLKDGARDRTFFILSEQAVPTWWTQPDATSTLLTGWLTGENMRHFQALDEQGRIASCLSSLAAIFSLDMREITDQLAAYRVFDWAEQPYVHGGYSFDTVMTPPCRQLLRTPVAETLYFAGEAVYEGSAPGTVEAAFHSGLEAAEKLIARL